MRRRIIRLDIWGKDDPYRIKGVYKKDDMKELLHLVRSSKRSKSSHGMGIKSNGEYRFNVHDKKQFCVIKLRYSLKKNSHSKFLNTYLTQENKDSVLTKPKLFGCEKEEYTSHMAEKHFRIIISPDNQNVDTKILVEELVKKMEQETGYRFYWIAAEHTDTLQKHAHLLINGVDRNGKVIILSPHFIKKEIRDMARNICTTLIGERTPKDIKLAKEHAFTASRLTHLDDQILARGNAITGDEKFECMIKNPSDTLQKRLAFLCTIGIAAKENNTWKLEHNWAETLKAMGRYNTFLSVRHDLAVTQGYNLSLYTDTTGPITGTVKKIINMDDEAVWNNAIIVENKQLQKAWYVPMYYPVSHKLQNKEIVCNLERNQKGLLTPSIKIKNDSKINREIKKR